MCLLMKHYRYQIDHQKDGAKHGISSFHSAFPSIGVSEVEGRLVYSRFPEKNAYLIQVVRNPWRVIESDFLVEGNPSIAVVDKFPKVKGRNLLETSIKSVVFLNKRIQSFSPCLVVKVEQALAVISRWLENHGLFIGTSGLAPAMDTNHKDHKGNPLTTEDYSSVSPEVMESLREHCQKYGYSDEIPKGA